MLGRTLCATIVAATVIVSTVARADDVYLWTTYEENGLDWNGADVAYTTGPLPKYRVDALSLCGRERVGRVATCWTARAEGYPRGLPTDFPPAHPDEDRPDWCAYKNESITIDTPPTGMAPPGITYICARVVGGQ